MPLSQTELKEKLRADALLFGKICLPNMFQVKTAKFHRELADIWHNQSCNKVNIIAPRGHAKSSLGACVFVLHHLLTEPGTKLVLLVSKTEGHSTKLLQTIKDALDFSLPLRAIYGYHGEMNARAWKNNEIVLDTNDAVVCRGTGQHIVGLKHINQRPTLIVLDDPEDMTNTKTAESMEFNLRWLLQTLLPAVDPLRGRVFVIGTPQHQSCMVEKLAEMEGWITKRYKAIQDDGTALWPEWWSIEKLLQEKSSLESINRVSSFYREYQCQIIGDEDQLFKKESFRYWDGFLENSPDGKQILNVTMLDGVVLPKPDRRTVNVFMGVDPASSTEQTANYSAIVPVAVDFHSNRFVLPYFRGHVKPMALADKVIQWYQSNKPIRTRIETVGYQEMLREYLNTKMYIPGTEIRHNPRNSKSHRLETLEPFFFSRRVFLRPNMSELEDELLMYPRGKNDDLLDGLYYAMLRCYAPTEELPSVRNDNIGAFTFESSDEEDEDAWISAG